MCNEYLLSSKLIDKNIVLCYTFLFKIGIVRLRTRILHKEANLETRSRILEKIAGSALLEEGNRTIREVISNRTLFRRLCEEPNAAARIAQFLDGSVDDVRAFRQLCMGVWLAMANEAAMDDNGGLLVLIDKEKLNFCGKLRDQRNMLLRQAVMRQIERSAVFRTNGLNAEFRCKSVLDIGGGTLIGSVMVREIFPEAGIEAVEPGLLTKRVKRIAQQKKVALFEGFSECSNNFDTILLHFVLEHDEKQAKDLLRESVRRLNPTGRISIAVPNFSAFHRTVETRARVNGRDTKSRLSRHDILSGHQVIFTEARLKTLAFEVMAEEKVVWPVQTCTILPRPLSFNLMCAMKQQTALHDLECAGHIPGLEEQGSVICMSIGNGAKQYPILVNRDGETARMFRKLIGGQSGNPIEVRHRVQEAVCELYPWLFDES